MYMRGRVTSWLKPKLSPARKPAATRSLRALFFSKYMRVELVFQVIAKQPRARCLAKNQVPNELLLAVSAKFLLTVGLWNVAVSKGFYNFD